LSSLPKKPPTIKQRPTLEDVIDFIDTAPLSELQVLSERLKKAIELRRRREDAERP
jgi:hypothetical protein